MRKETTTIIKPYYNEFEDLTEVIPLKNKLRLRNGNSEGIKIASKKLPPGFFRPNTCQKPLTNDIAISQREIKTPSFGEFKKESFSLSIIQKNKSPLELLTLDTPQTLVFPIHQTLDARKQKSKKSVKRALTEDKDYQISHRESKIKRRITLNSEIIADEISRRNKLTLDTQIFLQQKKGIKIEYGNGLKLNIKKFFREGVQQQLNLGEVFPQANRLKSKKLPPLV